MSGKLYRKEENGVALGGGVSPNGVQATVNYSNATTTEVKNPSQQMDSMTAREIENKDKRKDIAQGAAVGFLLEHLLVQVSVQALEQL